MQHGSSMHRKAAEPDPCLPPLPFPCDEPLRELARRLAERCRLAPVVAQTLRQGWCDNYIPPVLQASAAVSR